VLYSEAKRLLEAEGLRVVVRSFGVEGWSDSPAGLLRFEIGRASDGGDEVSIRRDGPGDPLPGSPIRWFYRPTLAELIALLVAAQQMVRAGVTPSLFDALLDLDEPATSADDAERA
jgi:hypothetical protein